MNKFKGVFSKVDIEIVAPNEWNPKENINDNSFNMERYLEIKSNIEKKSLYLPIIVRKVKDKYEIIDGYHRWLACKELGYTEIMIWDLGDVNDEEAKSITLDSIYLNIPASEPMTAQIIKAINEQNPDALSLLPFTDEKIKEYLEMANFDWDAYKEEFEDKEGQKKEITCPKCGHIFTI